MPNAQNLRAGRVSLQAQVYHVTTCTQAGEPTFATFSAARYLIQALKQSDALGYTETLAFVVMPDHLHWLFQLKNVHTLPAVVRGVKSFSARRIGHPVWQKSFYDRGIRREDDLQAVARYLVANPVRAGLVSSVLHYSHWDAVWL
jgi:putative transposase